VCISLVIVSRVYCNHSTNVIDGDDDDDDDDDKADGRDAYVITLLM
jgi:hypothetical protein